MIISLIRTLILYLSLVVALRLMGKRQIGELEPTELVVTILVSELAAIPMQDSGIPLVSGLIPILILISAEILLSYFCLKSVGLRSLLGGRPCIVIRRGKIDRQKLKDMRVTADEIFQELRLNSIESLSDIKYGIIETNGHMSFIFYPKAKPVNAGMLSLSPPETGIPLVIISDGKFILENLRKLNQTTDWAEKQIRKQNILSVHDVFIMTADEAGNQFIQAKEERI